MSDAPTDATAWARGVYAAAAGFCAATCSVSYARWANFEYRTFDLAYYVQAIWQLIHDRFEVTVEHVPLLGNHVEPIVLLIAPLFAAFQHPIVFVFVQNAALAMMAPIGFRLAKRLGIPPKEAALLAIALLLAPATGYVALHEFHPEALTAPFLLLMLHARVARRLGRHWLWFTAVLACKENMALVLAAYCIVLLFVERNRSARELRAWYGWPLAVAVVWFVVCTKVITPALNSGGIDYLALYSHLGNSAGEIVLNAARQPQQIVRAVWQSSTSGNLIWALLLPFLGLPLLRLRWILISSPLLLQHLLSWRSSEWTIYFHYAAPLLPLLWFGMVEWIARLEIAQSAPAVFNSRRLAAGVFFACVVTQIFLGPAATMAATVADWRASKPERDRKQNFIAAILPNASVTAPLPYLSHLAKREKLYSLHYILKGLKTLSRAPYEPPPPPDFVLIDYDDTATFDSSAGYYHPTMRTVDGRVIPSSERLLHELLRQRAWSTTSNDELSLMRQVGSSTDRAQEPADSAAEILQFDENTQLLAITKESEQLSPATPLTLHLRWRFGAERRVFPWMTLLLAPDDGREPIKIVKGLCAPEGSPGVYDEAWDLTASNRLPPGEYSVAALFRNPGETNAVATPPVPLGRVQVVP